MWKSVDDFKKFLETDAGKEYREKLVAELKHKNEVRNKLVTTEDYVKWLEKFTKDNPDFNSDQWLYFPEKISKYDSDNVDLLCEFYSVIESYAMKNYIYPTPCDWGGYYSIRYNGKVYEIGLLMGQGAFNFCRTSNINEKAYVINFEEIANPNEEILVRTALIEKQLGRIDNLIEELCSNEIEIPIKAIIEKLDKVECDLKEKARNKKK